MKKFHEYMMSTTYNVYELIVAVLVAGILNRIF